MKIKRIFGKVINIFNGIKIDKKKLLIFIIGILVVIGVVFIVLNKKSDNERFKLEYEKLNDKVNKDGKKYPKVDLSIDNKFVYVNSDDVLDMFKNKGDGVIYLGYSSCAYCRSVVQVLNDTAEDTSLDKIYYLDMKKKVSKYNKLKEILGKELINKDNEIEIPLVLFVANGKIVSYKSGTLFSHTDPFDELDSSQKNGLGKIYLYGIRDVLKSIDSKKNN